MGFFLDKVINPSRKHYYDRYSIEELAWLAPPLEVETRNLIWTIFW
jgi:hypothetical protein